MEASSVVTCSACGCTSRDFACCEYCNANLTPVASPVAPTTCPITPEGPFYLSAKQAGLLTRPEASVTVFTPDKAWRLHWISSELWLEWKPRVEERISAAGGNRGSRIEDGGSEIEEGNLKIEDERAKVEERELMAEGRESNLQDSQLSTIDLPSSILNPPSSLNILPPCRIVEDLTGVWIVVETTGRYPEPWRGPVSEDPLDRLRHLAGVAGRGPGFWDENPAEKLGHMVDFLERLAEAMKSFHHAGLVWLPFHPNWIEEFWPSASSKAAGSKSAVLRATNLDLAVHSFVTGTPTPDPSLTQSGGERTAELASVSTVQGVGKVGRHAHRTLDMSRSGRLQTVGERDVEANSPPLPQKGEGSIKDFRMVPAWTPPEVFHDQVSQIGPRTDVYHLALFTYYWLSGLLPKGFPGKGLAFFDFAMPPLRVLAPTLPVGIAGAVMAGLEVEPGRRPVSPRAFCAELRAALHEVRKRANPCQRSAWDIGSHTRTGRTKEAKGGVNQDAVLIRRFPNPERVLLVVADGLSCCDVGSGDVASRLVCEAIDVSFGQSSHGSDFSTEIPCACRRGAEAMLAWALDGGERLRLKTGQDLMATTVLAAWLEGGTLTVANAGDSRAYLIHERGIEQLTVDADLGCTLLAAGSPPENVIELGPVTRALRSCVGGVLYKSATDELVVDDARFRLVVNRWKLLPGETVILCSDGLVEEGAFLEPEELLELVRQNSDLSAEALAVALSEAADARQSLPSQDEPEGCGDNISCCVIKIDQ
jgi:protein phosphatase